MDNNIYTIGTQNGKSPYFFTSFESAVSNAIDFCNKEIPETKKEFEIKKQVELKYIVLFLIIIIFILIFYYFKNRW